MENNVKTQQELEQEMLELNEQFTRFLLTKGIKAKFKLAFANMAEGARKQGEQDARDNADFVEFLHTKGIKAKYRLVVENIKKGAAAAPANTAAQIARIQAETQAAVANANALGKTGDVSAETLAEEFNAFLKMKGLDAKYTVSVTEE